MATLSPPSPRTFTLATDPDYTQGSWDRPSFDGEAPLPLTVEDAIRRAIQLRNRARRRAPQFGWNEISLIMGEYHGQWYSGCWWSRECRKIDPSLARPRGNAFGSSARPS